MARAALLLPLLLAGASLASCDRGPDPEQLRRCERARSAAADAWSRYAEAAEKTDRELGLEMLSARRDDWQTDPLLQERAPDADDLEAAAKAARAAQRAADGDGASASASAALESAERAHRTILWHLSREYADAGTARAGLQKRYDGELKLARAAGRKSEEADRACP